MPSELTQFKPGERPVGRQKGSKNKITLLKQMLELQLREAAAPRIGEVLDKAFDLAVKGDRTMIKLLLELHMAKGSMDTEKAQEKAVIEIKVGSNTAEVKPPLEAEYIDVTEAEEAD